MRHHHDSWQRLRAGQFLHHVRQWMDCKSNEPLSVLLLRLSGRIGGAAVFEELFGSSFAVHGTGSLMFRNLKFRIPCWASHRQSTTHHGETGSNEFGVVTLLLFPKFRTYFLNDCDMCEDNGGVRDGDSFVEPILLSSGRKSGVQQWQLVDSAVSPTSHVQKQVSSKNGGRRRKHRHCESFSKSVIMSDHESTGSSIRGVGRRVSKRTVSQPGYSSYEVPLWLSVAATESSSGSLSGRSMQKTDRRRLSMRLCKETLVSRKREIFGFFVRDILWGGILLFVVTVGMLMVLFLVVPRHDSRLQTSVSGVRGAIEEEWSVFYNVYVPFDSAKAIANERILEEQLAQVGQSYANLGSKSGTLTVFFTTIGRDMETDWISDLCSAKYDMNCVHIQHHRYGTETVTLSELHRYCSQHSSRSVVYLHNKGSLHPNTKGQDRWRQTMTAAATSELCLETAFDQHSCSSCGMLFQPLPTNHFPGNMWSAKCEYVNELLSPQEYHARRPVIEEWIRNQTVAGVWSKYSGLFPLEAHYTGRDRYEAEHWIGSHPDIRPCDVSQSASLDYWLESDRDYQEFLVSPAPRHNLTAEWKWHQYASHPEILTNSTQRKRDFFLLRGILYRYFALYRVLPKENSWIWNWFPDGDYWRRAVQQEPPLRAVQSFAGLPGVAEIRYPPTLLSQILQSAEGLFAGWRGVKT